MSWEFWFVPLGATVVVARFEKRGENRGKWSGDLETCHANGAWQSGHLQHDTDSLHVNETTKGRDS